MAILPGSRIRDNGAFGTVTDNPLTAGATTFNSAELNRLGVVSSNHALVTLDPLRAFGEPEIVMVTAHTAGATVATIQRGMFGTIARSHPQTTLWVHAACDNDFEEVVTSITRPADQYNGQVIYETDTVRTMRHNGTTWIQDGLLFDPPACRLTKSADQSIPDNSLTVISFNQETFDTNLMHDTVTNNSRITFNTAGLYVVMFNMSWPGQATLQWVEGRIRLNGTTSLAASNSDRNGAAFGPVGVVSLLYKFAAADYIEALAYQDNTDNVAINLLTAGSGGPTAFSAVWIGRGN